MSKRVAHNLWFVTLAVLTLIIYSFGEIRFSVCFLILCGLAVLTSVLNWLDEQIERSSKQVFATEANAWIEKKPVLDHESMLLVCYDLQEPAHVDLFIVAKSLDTESGGYCILRHRDKQIIKYDEVLGVAYRIIEFSKAH